MPIVIPKKIPAYDIMEKENIFVMTQSRAESQDIRPIEIAILNLMPTKIETETQFIRLLSNSPLQVNLTLLTTKSYVGKNTAIAHLDNFYQHFYQVKDRKFDGMIITGAPVEQMDFEEVLYFEELREIFEFTQNNVTSTMYICWGAQAALYHYYKIGKVKFAEKLFGVFEYERNDDYEQLLKGVDDIFYMPQSRHTGIIEKQLEYHDDLVVLAQSKETGPAIIKTKDNSKIFITGHLEYDKYVLETEYKRDLNKGFNIKLPSNYYKNGKIVMKWRATANVIFTNWLNYYVYQVTPYLISEVKK